jgi:acyl-CoA synthetase (AMP-forming)/AMP-acid ligase II
MSISEVIRLHGRLRPDKDAIVAGERRITYRSLDRRLDGFCAAMANLGVVRGDAVAVALGDTAEHLIALLGLARLGATIVPIDHRWTAAEQRAVAESFGARRILIEPQRPETASPWVRVAPAWFDERDRAYVDPAVGPDTPLVLSLSSGTTGMPKGPCATHQQYENRFMAYWLHLGFTSYERYVTATPLYFGGGRGFSWANLFAGATVFLCPPPFEPQALVDFVRTHEGTAMFLVPTLLRRLLDLELDGLAFPSMRCLISSGSALFADERRAIRARLTPNLYEMYSSSEGGAVSVLGPADVDSHPDSVGRPCFRVQVETVDENHAPVPRGETGRLRYRSPASPTAYFGGEANAEAFRDGWYYPGDLAAIADDGFIYLRGRSKDMIIRGGVNIYPIDVEQALMRSGKLKEAAVVGIPSRELGEEVAAFVVAAAPTDESELAAVCRSRLAPYKVPRHFVFVDELPRNNGGKVVKGALVDMLSQAAPPRER